MAFTYCDGKPNRGAVPPLGHKQCKVNAICMRNRLDYNLSMNIMLAGQRIVRGKPDGHLGTVQ